MDPELAIDTLETHPLPSNEDPADKIVIATWQRHNVAPLSCLTTVSGLEDGSDDSPAVEELGEFLTFDETRPEGNILFF
jgi:hypothetical protein